VISAVLCNQGGRIGGDGEELRRGEVYGELKSLGVVSLEVGKGKRRTSNIDESTDLGSSGICCGWGGILERLPAGEGSQIRMETVVKSKLLAKIFFGGLFFLFLVGRTFSSGISISPPGGVVFVSPYDITGPNVSITSPSDGFVVTTPEVVIQGLASDASGVAGVDFSVLRPDGGGFGGQRATGTTSWSADVQGLAGGTNVVRIRAWDVHTNVTEATIHIYFFQRTPLTVLINGEGTVKPNLSGKILDSGKPFAITEKPAKGYVFAGWTGILTSSDATLNFVMRSNMVIHASFVPTPFVPAAGTYTGVIAPVVLGPPQLAGSIKAKITQNGKFTAKIWLGDKSYPLSGAFLVDGSYSGLIRRKKLPNNPVKVQLQLDINARTMSGIITDMSWSAAPTGALSATMRTR